MKDQVSQQYWERISAYLDGQLDTRAAEKLKRDLEVHPELQKAFEDLQHYKAILKQIPMRRARRNFTLKPEMVGIKPMPRLVPVFRLASAVIAAAAVVLFAIDLLPSLTNYSAAVPKAALTSAESAPSSAPEIIYWNGQQNYLSNHVGTATPAPGLGMGEGGGYGGGGSAAPVTVNMAPTPPPVMLPAESVAPSAGQVVAPPPGKAVPPTEPTPAPTPTVNPALSPTEIAMDQAIQSGMNSPILGIAPTDQQGQIIPAPGETLREAITAPQPSRVLTFLGIGLFLLAAAGGIFSWALARKR